MGATPPNRQYSRLIVAPDVWPTTREACEEKASSQRRVANATASAADTHRGALNGLRVDGVAQSTTGFEAMHQAYWRFQVDADNKADIDSAAADLMDNVATIQHDAERRIDSIDADAHNQLASVPNRSPQAIGIITSAATLARGTAVGAAEEITALSGHFGQRFGPVPESPPSSDPESREDSDRSTDKRTDETPEPPHGTSDESGETQHRASTPDAPEPSSASGTTVPRVSPGQPLAPPSSSPVPSSPSTGRGPTSALGGIGSGGGGFGGGASSLSSSGASPGGLGGLGSGLLGSGPAGGAASTASPATSSASSPAAAFSRALPVVPPTSFVSGANAASSPATVAAPPPVNASAAPLMSAPSGVSHSPVGAAPNSVNPQSISGLYGGGSGAPAQAVGAPGALLPPGAMGPPPAVPTASAAAASVGGPAAAMTPAAASVAAATAVATPVATLPSRVAAAAARDFERLRNESSDLQMVKRLAWQLLAASESGRSFALWAVGVMYSATGERQVVAVSHHGAGYVPPGIAVPTDLRMAWADPIISDSFRQRWTGNLDPAATLVAYAELKAGESATWHLGAAATTWAEVDALMTAAQRWGTEWAACSGMNMPGGIEKQALTVGAETTHRLAGEFPVLANRVAELEPKGLDQRAAKLITDALVSEARLVVVTSSTMPGESRLPANFDNVWPAAAESTVSAAERARFAEAVQQQWLSVGIAQPGWDQERSASIDTEYRGQWLISRALEAVLGWIADPGSDGKPAELPMADIVYAAAHAHLDGRGTGWITDLFAQAERHRL